MCRGISTSHREKVWGFSSSAQTEKLTIPKVQMKTQRERRAPGWTRRHSASSSVTSMVDRVLSQEQEPYYGSPFQPYPEDG